MWYESEDLPHRDACKFLTKQMYTKECHKHHAYAWWRSTLEGLKILNPPFPLQTLTSAMSSAEGSLTSLNHVKKVLPFPLRLFRLACCWALLVKSMPSFHLISVELDSGSPIYGIQKQLRCSTWLVLITSQNTYSTRHEFCSPHRGSSSVENPRCPPCVSVFHGVLFFYTQKSTETHGGSRSDIDSRALSGPPSVWKISNCL